MKLRTKWYELFAIQVMSLHMLSWDKSLHMLSWDNNYLLFPNLDSIVIIFLYNLLRNFMALFISIPLFILYNGLKQGK